jgi:excisionase family DNA binding protein
VHYKIIVSRFQTAERQVRAANEEDAIRKVQAELDRPYGLFASWSTIGTDINIVGVEGTAPEMTNDQIRDTRGTYLLSIKQVASYLGVSRSMLYEAVRSGDIAHVSIGSRRYISRDQINEFVEANSRHGH